MPTPTLTNMGYIKYKGTYMYIIEATIINSFIGVHERLV